MTPPRRTRFIVIGLVLVGFALRVFQLGASNFRGDEAFTVQYWIMPPLDIALAQYTTLDPQPPLAYASYHLWGALVGRGEFAVRVLPMLAGVLSIPLMFRFARRVFRTENIALLATAFWAVHPFAVFHAQDARNYALWSALSLASAWLALRALECDRPRDWVIYVTVAAATGYVYYLEIFVFAALSLYVLIAYWRRWHVYLKWGTSMLLVGGILAPWYLQPRIRSGGGYTGTTTGFDLQRLLVDFPRTLNFGEATLPAVQNVIFVPVLIVFVMGLWLVARRNTHTAWLLGMLGGLPVLLLAVASTRLDILQPRYVLASTPAFTLIAAAAGYIMWTQKQLRRLAGSSILAGWMTLNAVALYQYYTAYTKAPDWRALIAYLDQHTTPDDLVIQTAVDPGFGYYYNDVYAVPAPERALPAAPNQPAKDIEATLNDIHTDYDSVWLAAQGFTDWPSYGVVEAWMEQNMQRVVDTDIAGLRAEQYMPWSVSADEITTDAPLATFGDVAELVDVRVIEPTQPTGEQVIWAYWRPLEQTNTLLKVFVHLAGPVNPETGSPLWSQSDQEPQNARTRTTNWQPGTLYRDIHMLPNVATLPPDEYTVIIGLYNPATGERLQTESGDNAYTLGTLTLPSPSQ